MAFQLTHLTCSGVPCNILYIVIGVSFFKPNQDKIQQAQQGRANTVAILETSHPPKAPAAVIGDQSTYPNNKPLREGAPGSSDLSSERPFTGYYYDHNLPMNNMGGKRKRESMDQGGPVAPPGPQDFRASSSDALVNFDPSQYVHSHHESDMPPHFADALVQHNAGDHMHNMHHNDPNNGQSATDTATAALHYSMSVQQPGEDAFLQEVTEQAQHPRESSATLNFGEPPTLQSGPNPYEFSPLEQLKEPSQQPEPQQQLPAPQVQQPTPTPAAPEQSPPGGGPASPNKPAVGTDAWHKVRKDNHKEVERRRRETINEGINEIAKIVPGCEKNKGSILQRAVQFIQQLKENESQNIEKWTLEKLLTEQAISELSNSCDKLKAEVESTRVELEAWRRCAERAGVQPTDEDHAAAAAAIGTEGEE